MNEAKIVKEACDTLKRSSCVRRSIEVEDEGGSIVVDLQQDENLINPIALSHKWMMSEEFAEEAEK